MAPTLHSPSFALKPEPQGMHLFVLLLLSFSLFGLLLLLFGLLAFLLYSGDTFLLWGLHSLSIPVFLDR